MIGYSIIATTLTVALFLRQENVVPASPHAHDEVLAAPAPKADYHSDVKIKAPAHSKQENPSFAASLRGTERDGKLRIDKNGNLIIERGIRDLFDYYLTTLGENDLTAIRKQLTQLFDGELPPAAALQANELLDAYLQYRELSGDLQQQYPALDENNAFTSIADYFAQRDALRNQLFEPDAANAFFSADQADERDALPKLRQLMGETPDHAMADRVDAQDSYATYRATMRAAKNTDMTTPDQDALRMRLFGREATDRLAALDLRRSDWNARLSSYREQKQQLLATATEAGIDPSDQLTQLQQSQFSEREILRVRALDEFAQ